MKYAMLSTLIPEEMEEEYREKSRKNMQDAANALQWSLYQGLCNNVGDYFPLINVLPAGSFPQYYRSPFITKRKFSSNGINVGFCNIKLIRNLCKTRHIYRELEKWYVGNEELKTLFVYTLSASMIRAVSRLKACHPDLIVCAIVADLPNMSSLSVKQSIWKRIFIKLSSDKTYKHLDCIDQFVLLTKYMADYMHISQPYMVMEGIAPKNNESDMFDIDFDGKEKVIIYSGTLHRRFGILHLIEAFRKIKDSYFRLVLCGIGDSENEIIQAREEDKRIIFRGQLPRAEVLNLQKTATVLVNPRMNNEEFTKYSFPSKTMEYLASGVPVVAYKLDGIPDEYDSYILYPKDDTTEALAEIMQSVCEMPVHERQAIGTKGKDFVLGEKNQMIQTRRILDFLVSHKNDI